MAAVTAVDSPLAAALNPTAARKTDEVEDRFLALLVSQLKNQDPLNPLANSEVTTQLAQINTVKGLDTLNATLKSLVGQVTSGQSLQAAALVGRQVLVAGDSLGLAGAQATAGFALPEPVDDVVITVRDVSGLVMHTASLGKQAAGLHTFTWDGITDSGKAAADGQYRFELAATAAGRKVSAEALALGRVDGVVPSQDGPAQLRLGGLAPVSLAQVRQIL